MVWQIIMIAEVTKPLKKYPGTEWKNTTLKNLKQQPKKKKNGKDWERTAERKINTQMTFKISWSHEE